MSLFALLTPCEKCHQDIWRLGEVTPDVAEWICFGCCSTRYTTLAPGDHERLTRPS